ncbi:MAG: hypothetical protein R3311_12570, partial [Oceanisphaera sp.]|nr:hypothetical protein [Oceanisphaera sp.]
TDRDQIGVEKAGIFRPGADAVLGSDDLPATVVARAEALNAPVSSLGQSHGADGQSGDSAYGLCAFAIQTER